MIYPKSSVWKKSLVLLAFSATRRDAVIAFLQTTALTSSTTSSPMAPLSAAANLDIRTAPLSHLVHLEQQQDDDEQDDYHLVSPTNDELPLEPGQRLVCIGDVHGDFKALEEFLTIGGVYDANASHKNQWIGGNTILVQCGDVLDRGDQELLCFNLLTRLSQQAATQGGHVVLLWGNHEAMNAGGMFHYTMGEEEYENAIGKRIDEQLQTERWRMQYAGNQPARWAAYEPGSGVLAHPLLSNMKVAVKVGRTVCVHAGLTTQHLDDYGGLRGMNEQVQNWMKQAYQPNNNLGDYESIGALVYDVQKRAQTGSERMPELLGGGAGADGPVWMRDYSSPNDVEPNNAERAQQMLDGTLFHLQADRMVMGHTVQRKINAALNGKAWRVDVGASRGVMNGTPEVLEVVATQDGEEVVSVLTKRGKVPAEERLVGRPVAAKLASAVSMMLQG
ncbi:serine threonine-protein phosphatase [Seminavis robusta]|uniref:Serine threonine-protein phosphatase n=1 Tax=Seminavis robusta TaxID=568900 RepID=A0A9N8EWW9_9STRA|nr:serine threonine-protein phosphatase [Seminavis robusta]|eukprot:Sro2307_g322750.1 serine threonine-protein phosphatase (447) ;mRNA; f:1603-3048